ncbi:MAG TPA: intradiol ring-cleavage dioxygenase [Amycolatopsis sp.]|uniref:intradiol ring-cleavage dioxygenase n=1 Tax=Amycolatopsis sp. TaxID=37632 RepID=UPI002B492820|nr:intradiol ring-cleavage dioxygenase [Amycolatopsis sp.]HKS47499.1 intradiol ring-cleavage dioxygenase [Amycolatopsis sp.]
MDAITGRHAANGSPMASRTTTNARQLFTEEMSADVVTSSLGPDTDPRVRRVLTSLVRHLHAFVKEVQLTDREWEAGIEFLTATGQKCDDLRQEFILLSDVLGVSMLVETINHRAVREATEQTVLGPFHLVSSPDRPLGADINLTGTGKPCLVTGSVRDIDGRPVPGATVDVWQADADGFYDVQKPEEIPERNLRGLFRTDAAGDFWFRTIVPRYYPIPVDGPVGDLLRATGRHPYRPAHIHFIVEAPGFETVTTHIFHAEDPYLDSDAVFGVKESLIRTFAEVDDEDRAAAFAMPNPFHEVRFDCVLRPSGATSRTARA